MQGLLAARHQLDFLPEPGQLMEQVIQVDGQLFGRKNMHAVCTNL